MSIERNILRQLEKGEFQAVEDEWLAATSQRLEDLDYFVGIARALIGHGEESRAAALLEVLDDQLSEQQLWAARLELLRRSGAVWISKPEKLHTTILGTLRQLHGQHSSFDDMAEKLGLKRAPQDIPKTWEKVDRLLNLISFDIGQVVWMEGKGAGRITEINMDLESFRVDFEVHKGLAVGFRAAAKLLRPLPVEHILYRKLEDPEPLRGLIRQDPPQLLRLVLESYDQPRAAKEIRQDLAGIVDEKQWTSWWSAARKHPQVVPDPKNRQAYSWAETNAHAVDSTWAAFTDAEPRQQLELLRREGDRDPDLGARMTRQIQHLADTIHTSEPGLAFEIWHALERASKAPADVAWSPARLLQQDPQRVLAGIQDRTARERAYQLLRQHRDDWARVYLQLLPRETDNRSLNLITSALEEEAGEELGRFFDQLLSKPRAYPAIFAWLAERAAQDEQLQRRNPLVLLQQLLNSLQDDSFAAQRTRLLALVESGGTLPRLLPHLTEEQAASAERAIERAPALQEYQREALRTALHLRFPALRTEPETVGLYALPESIDAKRAEFEHIKSVELPANRKAIEEARAMGDLRENFEYKSARQRHEYLSARLAGLSQELSRVQPIQVQALDGNEVRVGTRVRLADNGGQDRWLTILGPWESKPEEDIISYESELAASMLGLGIGSTVEISGVPFTIREIAPYR